MGYEDYLNEELLAKKNYLNSYLKELQTPHTDESGIFRDEMTLRHLGIKIKLPFDVRVKYEKNEEIVGNEKEFLKNSYFFESTKNLGHMIIERQSDSFVLIKIQNPSREFIKSQFKNNIDLIRENICYHEETHAMQATCNWTTIGDLIEELSSKKIPEVTRSIFSNIDDINRTLNTYPDKIKLMKLYLDNYSMTATNKNINSNEYIELIADLVAQLKIKQKTKNYKSDLTELNKFGMRKLRSPVYQPLIADLGLK